MLVLGVYGSPRKGGNSDFLLDKALEGAAGTGAETERVFVRRLKNLSGCVECGGCDDTGECVIDDDMQEIYPLLDKAGAIILAAPIFFYNVPAQAKSLIDRAQARWSRRILEKGHGPVQSYDRGRGYLIGVGATGGQNLFNGLELTARYFYDALDKSYEGGVLARGIDAKGEAAGRDDLAAQAGELGRRAALES